MNCCLKQMSKFQFLPASCTLLAWSQPPDAFCLETWPPQLGWLLPELWLLPGEVVSMCFGILAVCSVPRGTWVQVLQRLLSYTFEEDIPNYFTDWEKHGWNEGVPTEISFPFMQFWANFSRHCGFFSKYFTFSLVGTYSLFPAGSKCLWPQIPMLKPPTVVEEVGLPWSQKQFPQNSIDLGKKAPRKPCCPSIMWGLSRKHMNQGTQQTVNTDPRLTVIVYKLPSSRYFGTAAWRKKIIPFWVNL